MKTEDELIEELIAAANAVDGDLTLEKYKLYRDRNNRQPPHPDTYMRRFGSWNEAKLSAGLGVSGPSTKGRQEEIPKDELLHDMRKTADDGELSMVLYTEKGTYSPATIVNRFGSWSEAKDDAGLKSTDNRTTATTDEIVEELEKGKSVRQVSDELGYNSGISLKSRGIELRNKMSPVKGTSSRTLSVPEKLLAEEGFEEDDKVYYEIVPSERDGELVIKISNKRVKRTD